MELTIDLSTEDENRLLAAARRRGLEPHELAWRLITENLPTSLQDDTAPDKENAAAIALLRGWLAEGATDDPVKIRQAERDLADLKSCLNANRLLTGERQQIA